MLKKRDYAYIIYSKSLFQSFLFITSDTIPEVLYFVRQARSGVPWQTIPFDIVSSKILSSKVTIDILSNVKFIRIKLQINY